MHHDPNASYNDSGKSEGQLNDKEQPMRRQYNPRTKYGRRKGRQQAQYEYDTGTPEYRNEIDNIKNWFWFFVIIFGIIVGFLIYQIGGEKALLKWLK